MLPDGQSASYSRDADGRLVRQTVSGDAARYAWNEQSLFGDIVCESSSSGASAAYSYGGDDLVQRLGATSSYYIEDGLGSIVGLTDAAGAQTDRYR